MRALILCKNFRIANIAVPQQVEIIIRIADVAGDAFNSISLGELKQRRMATARRGKFFAGVVDKHTVLANVQAVPAQPLNQDAYRVVAIRKRILVIVEPEQHTIGIDMLPLFIDGARMGYGLASDGCDVTLSDIASLADVFYLGGTKQGALFGEAVVIVNDALKKDFRYFIKQNGGMLAKGRLLGIQFLTLFEDGLYFQLSKHAVAQAMRIRDAFRNCGYGFLVDSPSNQQFPVVDNATLERLSEDFLFSFWQKIDEDHSAVRFCTSWATRPEAVDALVAALQGH